MDPQNFNMLANFGISQNIFSLDKESVNTEVFVIKQEKIKKNFSEGAITKIPDSIVQDSYYKSKDDMGLYDECDQEYSVFGNFSNQKNKIENEINFNHETKFHSKDNSHIYSLFSNYNDFNFNNNYANNFNTKKSNDITKNYSNFSTYPNFSSNFNLLSKNEIPTRKCSQNEETTGQKFSNNENCDINQNNTVLNTKKFCNTKNKTIKKENENFEIKTNVEKNKNNLININNYQNSNKPDSQEVLISNNPQLNLNEDLNLKNCNFSNEKDKIENIYQNYDKSQELFNKEELKNGIFENSMQNQMEQLNRIFFEMNQSSEAKVIIKAYKSKLKTKFYKIYESNSEFYKEKNKFKIFHRCNFPGCSRTFASAGWLKSHFNEHLQELKSNKFNLEFEKSLMKLKHMNLLN